MPGFDRTGPEGAGPMTGGGWGWCGRRTGRMWPEGGSGLGLGRGFRRGFGGGFGRRGAGRRYWFDYPVAAGPERISVDEELSALKRHLEAINARVEALTRKPETE